MYWTDYGTDTIEKVSMDGTSRTVLVSTGLSNPYGITIDYDNQVLYWVDYSTRKLEKVNTDGSGRQSLANINRPYHVTYYNDILYWCDTTYDRVLHTDVSSPSSGSYLTSSVSYSTYGIQVIARDLQPDGRNKSINFCVCNISSLNCQQVPTPVQKNAAIFAC